MCTHMLTILGTGNYQPVDYSFGGTVGQGQPQRFIQVAIAKAHSSALEKITVFLTDGARMTHWDALSGELAAIAPHATIEGVSIPDGRNEAEIWDMFSIVYDAIGEGDDVVLDITHSFRSIPFVLFAIINYARVLKQCTVSHVYYGAFEARNPESEVAPVFDMLPMIEIANWSNAASIFVATGSSSELRELYGRSNSRSVDLQRSISSMEDLSKSLLTCRGAKAGSVEGDPTRSIHAAVLRFNDVCAPSDWSTYQGQSGAGEVAALSPLFDFAREKYMRLHDYNAYKVGILTAEWYLEHGMIPQGFIALEESVLTLACERHPFLPSCREGKKAYYRKANPRLDEREIARMVDVRHRHILDAVLNLKSEHPNQTDERVIAHVNGSPFIYDRLWRLPEEEFALQCYREVDRDLAMLCKDISTPRNDISHFGTGLSSKKGQVLSASELSAALEDLISRAKQFI